MKQKFKVGQEVRLEFIGTVTKASLVGDRILYELEDDPKRIIGAKASYVKESHLSELEEPK